MTQTGSSAWWADVQHLRSTAERTDEARRRADQADLADRRARRERRDVEGEVARVAAPQQRRRLESDPAGPRRRDHDASRLALQDLPIAPRRSGYDAASRVTGGAAVAAPARRTVEIRGRTVPAPAVPRSHEIERRRPPRLAVDRVASHPDRLAMWALLMGIVLILVALTSG